MPSSILGGQNEDIIKTEKVEKSLSNENGSKLGQAQRVKLIQQLNEI